MADNEKLCVYIRMLWKIKMMICETTHSTFWAHTRAHTHTHTHTHTQNAYVHQSLGMWMLYQEKLYEHIYEISYSYKLPMYNGPIRYVHNVVAERVMLVSDVYALILLE